MAIFKGAGVAIVTPMYDNEEVKLRQARGAYQYAD